MKRLLILLVLIFLTACVSQPTPVIAIEPTAQEIIIETIPTIASQPNIMLEPTEEPGGYGYTFVLLGGDWTSHRVGTDYGNNTDVMLLVSIIFPDPIHISEPIKIVTIQVPRNLYVPVDGMEDMWAFSVYGKTGFQGISDYIEKVFDTTIIGTVYIHMENFVKFIDALGGVVITLDENGLEKDYGTWYSGELLLEWLRDNENNWNYGVYDQANRQYRALFAIADRAEEEFRSDPVLTAKRLVDLYGNLFDTDMDDIQQLRWIMTLGYQVITAHMTDRLDLRFIKLRDPVIVRGDTPLETRGEIVPENGDLHYWYQCALYSENWLSCYEACVP